MAATSSRGAPFQDGGLSGGNTRPLSRPLRVAIWRKKSLSRPVRVAKSRPDERPGSGAEHPSDSAREIHRKDVAVSSVYNILPINFGG